MDQFPEQKTAGAPHLDGWANAVMGFTALYLVGWWILVANNALQFNFIGLPLRVWVAFAMGLHLATIFIATLYLYFRRHQLRIYVLVSFFVSLSISGVLMISLIRLEPPAANDYEVEPDTGFSATYRL